jgi:NAD(P)H-dependent flavin oxidoreductase YrpB (nitropropane dioxygenase family)
MDEDDPKALRDRLASMIPAEHREFVDQLLHEHGVPEWPDRVEDVLMGWTTATAKPQLDEALRHDKVALIANALGTPPRDVIDEVHASGRLVAALCGKVRQALAHKQAGIDIIIAQGHEGGGHTGEVGSIVLWPQVVQAVAPAPVLAAGGIGTGQQVAAALAVGAQGVWTGSLWLTVEEAQAEPEQKNSLLQASSEDTVRSRSWTGKPCRMLRNEWTEAWGRKDAPEPLGMPLQGMLTYNALRRTARYAGAGQAQQVAFNPAGQVIGQISAVESCRAVMFRLLSEYVDAAERLDTLMPEA